MPDDTFILDSFNFPVPTENEKKELLPLWATYYYVYKAKETSDGEPLLDKFGNPLGPKVSTEDWCKAAVEATIEVKDKNGKKTIYNYAAKPPQVQVDCKKYTPNYPEGRIRWQLANGPYGDGVPPITGAPRMILIPYRSIAVDRSQIPLISVIYIPAARGVEIFPPSGERDENTPTVLHDGYFYAADIGSAISGVHIDVFGGLYQGNPFPNFIKSKPTGTFTAYLIENREISDFLKKLHKTVTA